MLMSGELLLTHALLSLGLIGLVAALARAKQIRKV
jgi:hypothetical protein